MTPKSRPNSAAPGTFPSTLAANAALSLAAGFVSCSSNENNLLSGSEETAPIASTRTDTTAPACSALKGVTVSGPANDMIEATFSHDMIASEVETASNWTIESPAGKPFDVTGATIEYDEVTRVATLTLGSDSADQNLQTSDDIHATFSAMRSLAGRTIRTTVIGTNAVSGMVGGDTTPPTLVAAAPGVGTDLVLTFSESVAQLETSDLRTTLNRNGTDIVLTDASDPGEVATGTVAISDTVLDGDSITVSDGSSSVNFEFDYGAVGSVKFSGQPNAGDYLHLDDGVQSVMLEFDDGTVTSLNIPLGSSTSETLTNLLHAINDSLLDVTASPGADSSLLSLRNDRTGAAGNIPILNGDTANVQILTGMDGGGIAGDEAVAVDTDNIVATVNNLRDAIDSSGLNVVTRPGGASGSFVVENTAAGTAGNAPILEREVGDAIAVAGMSNGVDPGTANFKPIASTAQGAELQATVTFPTAPEPGDTVRIFGVTDLAGNQMIPVSAASVVTADSHPPGLVSGSDIVVNSGEFNDSVTVTFDADIHPDGALDPGNYTLAGVAAVDLSGATITMSEPDQVTFRFDKGSNVNLITADSHTLTASGIRNLQGVPITVTETDAGIAPSGDTSAPSIGISDASIDPNHPNIAIFTFDEAISETGGVDIANYTLTGNVPLRAAFLTGRVVHVLFASPVAISDSVDIAVGALTDLGGNASGGSTAVLLTAPGSVAPTIASVTATSGSTDGRDTVAIVFSEPVPTALARMATNYRITSDGVAVDLTGASLQESSVDDSVTIKLAEGISLRTGAALSVTPANLTNASGTAMIAAPTHVTVAGDTTAPSTARAFVNVLVDATRQTVEVEFEEAMDAVATILTANWSGSSHQVADTVVQLGASRYRVTFDATIGLADTISLMNPTDRAGNMGSTITVDPIE